MIATAIAPNTNVHTSIKNSLKPSHTTNRYIVTKIQQSVIVFIFYINMLTSHSR